MLQFTLWPINKRWILLRPQLATCAAFKSRPKLLLTYFIADFFYQDTKPSLLVSHELIQSFNIWATPDYEPTSLSVFCIFIREYLWRRSIPVAVNWTRVSTENVYVDKIAVSGGGVIQRPDNIDWLTDWLTNWAFIWFTCVVSISTDFLRLVKKPL